MRNLWRVALVPALLMVASSAMAQSASYGGIVPSVPVSSFARPAAWLDPSRLHVTTELSFGTGFEGGPAQGLQVTRLSYQFGQPLAVRVSVGNALGGQGLKDPSFFLEGLDLSYRPFGSFQVQVHYQDLRSPLQYSRYGFNPYYR